MRWVLKQYRNCERDSKLSAELCGISSIVNIFLRVIEYVEA
jgi:hypothetical protein